MIQPARAAKIFVGTMWLVMSCVGVGKGQTIEPAAMTVSNAVMHNLLRKLLPMQLRTGVGADNHDYWLGDLSYCGESSSASTAKVLALAYPGTAPPQEPMPILMASDCTASVPQIAQRLSQEQMPGVVATLRMIWSPWNLKLEYVDGAVFGPPEQKVQELKTFIVHSPQISSFVTSGVTFKLIDQVDGSFNMAIIFSGSYAQIVFYPAGSTATVPKAMVQSLGSGENMTIRIPYVFANGVISRYLKDKPIILSEGTYVAPEGNHVWGTAYSSGSDLGRRCAASFGPSPAVSCLGSWRELKSASSSPNSNRHWNTWNLVVSFRFVCGIDGVRIETHDFGGFISADLFESVNPATREGTQPRIAATNRGVNEPLPLDVDAYFRPIFHELFEFMSRGHKGGDFIRIGTVVFGQRPEITTQDGFIPS